MEVPLTVAEVLEAAREAALEIRRIEEQAEIRIQAIGPQGYSLGVHAKTGILDPMRKVDELMDWQESERDKFNLLPPIDEAWDMLAGAAKIASDIDVEIVTRYYLQAESIVEIVRGSRDGSVPPIAKRIGEMADMSLKDQVEVIEATIREDVAAWESIGIAHLKEMGRH